MSIGSWFSSTPVQEEKPWLHNHFATIAGVVVFGLMGAFWCCRRPKHHHKTPSGSAGKVHHAAQPVLTRTHTAPAGRLIPVGKPKPVIPPKPAPKGSAAPGVQQLVRRSENAHHEAVAGAPRYHISTSGGVAHPPQPLA